MRNAFIAAFLFSQIALPVSYYVGNDAFDERFAWRMFSPIRMVRCEVAFDEEVNGVTRPHHASRETHMAWISLMQRARLDVVRAYASRRCDQLNGETDTPVVRVDIACSHPDGLIRPIPLDQNLCEP